MAVAYIRFALDNPSHYQTMFSGALTGSDKYPDLARHGTAAFNILLDTITSEQQQGRIRRGNPLDLAEITWALSHGLATLGLAGQLQRTPAQLQDLAVVGCSVLMSGLRRKT